MNDEELRQAMAALETFKVQLDNLTRQSQILQISLEDAVKANETMKSLSKAKPGDEVLIPVGGASMVRAVVSENQNVLVGIGSKLSVDMKMDQAIEYMTQGSKDITEALKKLNDAIEEMSSRAQALQLAVQDEYRARQQKNTPTQ